MFNRIFHLLYACELARFPSSSSPSESAKQLSRLIKQPSNSMVALPVAGYVSEDYVELRRVQHMKHNAFRPNFYGRFEARQGGAFLIGKFAMSPLVQAVLTVWFAATAVLTMASVLYTLKRPELWFFALIGVVMFGAGYALVWLGKDVSAGDIGWLSARISECLPAVDKRPQHNEKRQLGHFPDTVQRTRTASASIDLTKDAMYGHWSHVSPQVCEFQHGSTMIYVSHDNDRWSMERSLQVAQFTINAALAEADAVLEFASHIFEAKSADFWRLARAIPLKQKPLAIFAIRYRLGQALPIYEISWNPTFSVETGVYHDEDGTERLITVETPEEDLSFVDIRRLGTNSYEEVID
ncbi:hypothetical protein VC279_23720 [Xanthomonas sp. WHRI 10064A]|uniref:hypothetical protein n=1 Tax=unclassified Xanthomonas TaxID=2643310 RepID=UPI002B228D15|nr:MULTISPECIES: hypothetical protein [unclassified Xanthomonas]MEA9590135.1 hypothetical protein [Xanthomonas sp. WHRI 10064B]MEA9617597.1 hypothetical protein [Xanthomonas sp. WHRI 10064A]